jgi:hypothetical protein
MDRRFQKWEKTRGKGKLNYVFLYGVLLWGCITAALVTFPFSLLMNAQITWSRALTNFILFPLAGIGWGHFTWMASEKAYQKAKASELGAPPNGSPARAGGSSTSAGPPSVS